MNNKDKGRSTPSKQKTPIPEDGDCNISTQKNTTVIRRQQSKTKTKCERVDIMLDLETLGLSDSPVITQLAAVAFDITTGESFDEFSVFIDAKSCIEKGLKIDGSTVEWWLKQDERVFKSIFLKAIDNSNLTKGFIASEEYISDVVIPENDRKEKEKEKEQEGNNEPTFTLYHALERFTQWVDHIKEVYCVVYANQYNKGNIYVWGNGALADNKWITQAYKACNMNVPWHFSNDRDVRTLVDMGQRLIVGYDPKKIIFKGEQHNALADCHHQIGYVCDIYKKLQTLNK